MKEKSNWVLSKSPFYFILFLFMIFLIVDVVFNLRILSKSQGEWYTNTGTVVMVLVIFGIGVGFLNASFSRIYFYNEFFLIKTLFKNKKILYKDITELKFQSSGTSSNRFFALHDKNGNFIDSISAQYTSNNEKKKKLISYLIKQQPTIKLNHRCEMILKNNR